jgi:hypothetical protein
MDRKVLTLSTGSVIRDIVDRKAGCRISVLLYLEVPGIVLSHGPALARAYLATCQVSVCVILEREQSVSPPPVTCRNPIVPVVNLNILPVCTASNLENFKRIRLEQRNDRLMHAIW